MQGEENMKSIYIASKTKHAAKWIALRKSGVNIISTWIDEAGAGETKDKSDLCYRCVNESMECDAMIVYAEEGDILRGAYIEMGIGMCDRLKPVYLVGLVLPHGNAFTYAHNVFTAKSVEEAIKLINHE